MISKNMALKFVITTKSLFKSTVPYAMKYYSDLKKKEILTQVVWMNLGVIMPNEMKQTKRTNTV